MAKELSEKRKSDRLKMATAIEALVTECGARFERTEGEGSVGSDAIYLDVEAPHGLRVLVDFDGKSSQPNVYVLSWYLRPPSVKKLNNVTFGGDVNSHHLRKATYVAYGFDDLCKQLRAGLEMARDGTAFLPEAAQVPQHSPGLD